MADVRTSATCCRPSLHRIDKKIQVLTFSHHPTSCPSVARRSATRRSVVWDGINDSDGNGISEINDHLSEIDNHSDDNETYEDNNKDALSESDDHSNDDGNYENFASYENPIEITSNTED